VPIGEVAGIAEVGEFDGVQFVEKGVMVVFLASNTVVPLCEQLDERGFSGIGRAVDKIDIGKFHGHPSKIRL
jgi:hypothetical protein